MPANGREASDPPLRTADFDYVLPPDLIAHTPAEDRASSRLMVVERRTAGPFPTRRFADLPGLLADGDLLVLNDTRVIPARFLGRKPSGAPGEVLLVRPAGGMEGQTAVADTWEALVRPGSKLKPGRTLVVAEDLTIEILDGTPDGGRVVRLRSPLGSATAIERYGQVPLPPYITRPAVPEDRVRYQTVYADVPGSVAAPTAGLHFTGELLERVRSRGVRIVRITLHVGPGTFRPVESEDPADHRMHEEWYMVPDATADAVADVRRGGGRVWAVGTTVTRALESASDEAGRIRAGVGTTRLFIRPPYGFRVVDGLITNFHLPRSTLLMLVSALAGVDTIRRAYRQAVADGYRFYSYGDAMVVT